MYVHSVQTFSLVYEVIICNNPTFYLASSKLDPHGDVLIPSFWMNTNVTSNNGWIDCLTDDGSLVGVSGKYLQKERFISHDKRDEDNQIRLYG